MGPALISCALLAPAGATVAIAAPAEPTLGGFADPAPAKAPAGEREIDPGFLEPEPESERPDREDRGERRPRGDAERPAIKTSVTRKAFFKGEEPARFSFQLAYRDESLYEENDIVAKVELTGKDDQRLERWKVPVEDAKTREVKWGGASKGKAAKSGKYRFSLKPVVNGDPIKAQAKRGGESKQAGGRFNFYDHQFPIPAKHTYEDGFGAGRNHKGHDVFSDCGNKLLAARGGEVKANQFQKSAGFYLVIDGAKTDQDYFYAHMRKRSKLKVGEKVKTGEQIGEIGDSGNASGCHVHFELWEGGWFESGGKAVSPTKDLKRWDKYS